MPIKTNSDTLITIFGGSGFLGRHVVRALAKRRYRIRVAVRRPELAGHLQPLGSVGQIHAVQANLRYPRSVEAAMRDASIAINLVGILFERGRQQFDLVQAQGAEQVAYFSVPDKLIQGFEITQETPMGALKSTIKLSDWKEKGDVKYFTKMTVSSMGQTMPLVFEEVEFNTVEKSIFERPDEVKALLEKHIPALMQAGPDFCSVTYGAGGSTREKTLMIVDRIQREHKLTALAHLTCVNHTRDQVGELLQKIKAIGCRNILALRGDPPG